MGSKRGNSRANKAKKADIRLFPLFGTRNPEFGGFL
jgi:hypothetical protein